MPAAPSPLPSPVSGPRSRAWLRRLAWAIGALLLLWGLSWLVVPWITKQQIEKQASARLGRAVQVGRVEFRPWSLELTLHDLSIAGREAGPPQLQVQRIYLNAELESLVRLAPVVESLQIDAPRVRLTALGEGRYDIDDVLQRLAAEPAAPAGDPLRFAVFNIAVRDGALDFDDRTVDRQHQLRNLQFSVPFLSNLASRREVWVEPKLAFDLNGSHFASSGEAMPFADGRNTRASFAMRDVDLAPYLPYLPQSLPVRVARAVAGVDLALEFEQRDKPVLNLKGRLQWKDVAITDKAAQPLLAFEGLDIQIEELRPLERVVKLGQVAWTAPQISLRRDAQGRLELPVVQASAAPAPAATAPAAPATPASGVASAPAAGASAPAGATAEPGGWDVSVAQVAVRGGQLAWSDASVPGTARLWLHDLGLELQGVGWPVREDSRLRGGFAVSASLPAAGAAAPEQGARVAFEGTASDKAADVQVDIQRLPVPLAEPYLAQFLVPALRGELGGSARVAWTPSGLKLTVANLQAEQLELAARDAKARAPLASVRRLALADTVVDLQQRSVAVGRLQVEQPRAAVSRARDGRWMYEAWLRAAAAESPAPAPSTRPGATRAPAGAAPADAWAVQVKDFRLEGGQVAYEDLVPSKPVAVTLSALQVQMGDWALAGRRPGPLRVSASMQAGQLSPGQLQYQGQLQMLPLAAQGNLTLMRLPVHAFEPYFADRLNIELLRADTSFRGTVRYADAPQGLQLRVAGDTSVDDFRANSLATSGGGLPVAEELLNWKSLHLRGVSVELAPGKAPAVAVQETALSDFYARVIISESGRINLQDLVKQEPVTGTAAPAVPGAPGTPASAPAPAAAPAGAGPAVAAVPPTVDPLAPVIQFGPVSLINGRVLFSDRFVKPNYSADLSDLTGKLGAFSSVAPQGQPQLADLELRGRAEGTASLEILGKLNPLATPLALDIQGKVRDLELPPLSPYSVKYAGHGIQRGKLSVDVAYRIQPDGQLTATNKLVLNQLSFGDPVAGAPNSLPVRLAVALLADRNGVIDIDLPISGSLNDPQFSVGPIIFKAIVNLIVKAITAPFSLLANVLGGGGEQLSTVTFAPGSAALSTDARAGLDKVAKALAERPALRMTVVGTADLERERAAYQRERLQALLVAEKRRQLMARGAASDAAGAQLVVGSEERPALLKEVFQRADIAKPRNAAGILQEVAPADMEALLLASITVTDEAIRELAVRRGVVVKDYLGAQNVPAERLFLGAVKPQAASDKWEPHAELDLSTN